MPDKLKPKKDEVISSEAGTQDLKEEKSTTMLSKNGNHLAEIKDMTQDGKAFQLFY